VLAVDTHAHLDDERFGGDLGAVIERARSAGVAAIVTVGTAVGSSQEAVRLAREHRMVYAAVGVHPHDASGFDAAALARLRELAGMEKTVAVGETGLDYYRNLSGRQEQRDAFAAQLRLAIELGKPAIIHVRDALGEALEIMDEAAAGKELRGVMHCYSGGPEGLEPVLSRGLSVSFTCSLTFPSSGRAREAAGRVPMERLLLETDCPYMAPQSIRGKRCEPAHVLEAARALAEAKRAPLEEILGATSANARRLFGLDLAGGRTT